MESLKLDGKVKFIVEHQDGTKDEYEFKNLITSAGKAAMASRLNGNGAEAAFTYVAIGTGAVGELVGDTALGTEYLRVAATCTRTTTSVANDTAVNTALFNILATKALTEYGCFNAAANGTMLNRATFSAINLVSGDSLTVVASIVCS